MAIWDWEPAAATGDLGGWEPGRLGLGLWEAPRQDAGVKDRPSATTGLQEAGELPSWAVGGLTAGGWAAGAWRWHWNLGCGHV